MPVLKSFQSITRNRINSKNPIKANKPVYTWVLQSDKDLGTHDIWSHLREGKVAFIELQKKSNIFAMC
jgi:hypothetical protein